MGHFLRNNSSNSAGAPMAPGGPGGIASKDFTSLSQQQQALIGPTSTNPLCHCYRFLHPYSTAGNGVVIQPQMQHYCRVCNIRLNSCRQAKIHADGKKHVKRLHYLKSLEATGGGSEYHHVPGNVDHQYHMIQPSEHNMLNSYPSQGTLNTFPTQYPSPYIYQSIASAPGTPQTAPAPPPAAAPAPSQMPPNIAQGPPPPPPAQAQPAPHLSGLVHGSPLSASLAPYHQVPSQPPFLASSNNYPAYQSFQDLYSPPPSTLLAYAPPPPLYSTTSMVDMSNSLTSSGFSGSGPDCSRSTETGSILSTASHSSSCQPLPPPSSGSQYYYQSPQYRGNYVNNSRHSSNNNNNNTLPRTKESGSHKLAGVSGQNKHHHRGHNNGSSHSLLCNSCFNGLDHGFAKYQGYNLRHGRRAESSRQYHGGANNNIGNGSKMMKGSLGLNGNVCEIKCEVCQVSVNSSHQLEAHLAGHKHRIRAVRRGLKPDQALASPSSSTLTSASESDHGVGNGGHQESLRRRSSEFNLLRTVGPAQNGTSGTRQRCYTASGGATAPSYNLSRHLSSGCLTSSAWFARSTTSLRKAISHTGLNKKSRSMNLLMMMEDGDNEDVEEEDDESDENNNEDYDDDNIQTPWSSAEGACDEGEVTTSSEDQKDKEDQVEVMTNNSKNTYQKEEFKNGGLVNQNQNIALSATAHKKSLTYKKDRKPISNKKVDGKKSFASSKKKKLQQQSNVNNNNSILSWRQPHHSNPNLFSKHNYNNNGYGIGNSNSFKEIPMLNVFLQRLNQHSFRRVKAHEKMMGGSGSNPGGATGNDSDFSSPGH